MFKAFTILMAMIVWSNLSYAYSFSEKEIKIVKESVLNLCKTVDGDQVKITEAEVLNTVLIKKLVEIDFAGEAEFTLKEWEEIKSLLPYKKLASTNYATCVATITPIFMDRFSKTYEEETDVDM